MNRHFIFTAYARLDEVDDFLKCGWIPTPALNGTGHGYWSVVVEWKPCSCGKEMPWPRKVKHERADLRRDDSTRACRDAA